MAGAGIGGLSAALFLGRRGIACRVYEARASLDETGAGVQLSPNASRLLIEAGLGPALAPLAATPDLIRIRAFRSGRALGTIPLGPSVATRHGAPYWLIRRADLHRILRDAVGELETVEIATSHAVRSARDGTEAHIEIEDPGGRRTSETARLLVAADGIGSACRIALPGNRMPAFSGQEAWRALVPRDRAPAMARANETGLWLGAGRHVVHYPVAGCAFINVVVVSTAARPRQGYASIGDTGELDRISAGAAEPLQQLLRAAENWKVWSLFDAPVGPMAGAAIALVGDAAHAVLPHLAQGAALAIEDAATLAAEIARRPDDISGGLAVYDAIRRPRANAVRAASRRIGRVYRLGGPLALARDVALRFASESAARTDWLYGWRHPA